MYGRVAPDLLVLLRPTASSVLTESEWKQLDYTANALTTWAAASQVKYPGTKFHHPVLPTGLHNT